MSKIAPPVIGEDLYRRLSELCEATRRQATDGRNFHAAALYVVLETLRVQAEYPGVHVAVHILPAGDR
jgi:hypothetical protein